MQHLLRNQRLHMISLWCHIQTLEDFVVVVYFERSREIEEDVVFIFRHFDIDFGFSFRVHNYERHWNPGFFFWMDRSAFVSGDQAAVHHCLEK